jgi:CrcB protein
MIWIAVALGGALGSMARHHLSLQIAQRLGRASPWATFAVNIVGCVCVGALAGRIASGHWQPDPWVRTFVFVGVLGGFTTFSAFGLETFTLSRSGDQMSALWNVLGQVGLGVGGVWLGFYLGLLPRE